MSYKCSDVNSTKKVSISFIIDAIWYLGILIIYIIWLTNGGPEYKNATCRAIKSTNIENNVELFNLGYTNYIQTSSCIRAAGYKKKASPKKLTIEDTL